MTAANDMQVSVEKTGAIERKLTVSVPHTEVERKIAERLRKVGRRARIPGFRPGKAPPDIIARRFGGEVTQEVVSDAIKESYPKALEKEAINPAGLLSVEPKPFVAGEDLQYVATIEVFPEIPSPTLAGRTIEKPVCEIGDADVERALSEMRKSHIEFSAREGKAEKGDRLTIDFDGTLNGKPLPNWAATGQRWVLGEDGMPDMFVSALADAAAGESKRIDYTFADDFPDPKVAGKAVLFTLAVKAVERPALPELDDAFAEKLGVESGGLAVLRERIEVDMRGEAAACVRAVVRTRVRDALVDACPIEVPKALVEGTIDRMQGDFHRQMEAQGLPLRDADDADRARLAPVAKRRAAVDLIIRNIIDQAGLTADRAAMRKRIEEMVGEKSDEIDEILKWYDAEPARLQSLEAVMLEEAAIKRMLETATVVEKKVSFEELLDIRRVSGMSLE